MAQWQLDQSCAQLAETAVNKTLRDVKTQHNDGSAAPLSFNPAAKNSETIVISDGRYSEWSIITGRASDEWSVTARI